MSKVSKIVVPLSDGILADRLGLTLREFQRYRNQGLIAVSVDVMREGAFQITCQLGNRIWEGMVEEGTVTSEQVRFMRGGPRAKLS